MVVLTWGCNDIVRIAEIRRKAVSHVTWNDPANVFYVISLKTNLKYQPGSCYT